MGRPISSGKRNQAGMDVSESRRSSGLFYQRYPVQSGRGATYPATDGYGRRLMS